MNLDDLIRLMSDFLRKFSVDHFAFGAVAMNFWIPPRFTHDLDLVLCIKKGALPQLVKELNGRPPPTVTVIGDFASDGRMVALEILDPKVTERLLSKVVKSVLTEFHIAM